MKKLGLVLLYSLFGSLLTFQAGLADSGKKDDVRKGENEKLVELEKGLKGKDLRQRANIAREIGKLKELPVDKRARLLITALKDEHLNPQSNEVETWTGYSTVTEFLKNSYVLTLRDMGEEVIPILKESHKKETGEMKEKIVVVLGYLGDTTVYDDLIEIIKKSKNPYNKAKAIRVISDSKIGGRELIPLYKELIKDDFHVRMKTDIRYPPEHDYKNIYYPVREEAFSALLKLGINVRRDKNEVYVDSVE